MKPINAPSLANSVISHLPFSPNSLQEKLIASLSDFLANNYEEKRIFLLNGYAGSGKTSIIGGLIKALNELKIKSVTLAPTGRAAKVAASFSGGKASTIHRRIFRPVAQDLSAQFIVAPNNSKDTLFIIDEASLIPDANSKGSSLLFKLLKYIYSAPGCIAIFVGDIAQLPPIGMHDSPAMNPDVIRNLGLTPFNFTLDSPMRPPEASGIRLNATNLRQLIFAPVTGMHPAIVS